MPKERDDFGKKFKADVDDETIDTFREMEAEGVDLSEDEAYKAALLPVDDKKDDDDDKGDDDDEEEDDEESEDEDKEEDDEDNEEDNEDDDDDDEDEEEDDDDKKKQKKGIVKIPISEVKRERRAHKKELRALNEKIEVLKKKDDKAETVDEKEKVAEGVEKLAKALSEKYDNIPDGFVKDFMKGISEMSSLPKDLKDKLDALEVAGKEAKDVKAKQDELKDANKQFDKDMEKLAKKHPNRMKHKDAIHKLAFSAKYKNYSLRDIWKLEKKNIIPDKKRTMEDGTGGKSGKGKKLNVDELSGEEIENMSDEEFDEMTELAEKESGSGKTLKRKGVVINR